jgi:integral membrane protein
MFRFDTTLNRIRSIGIFEAISFLLLLGVAMPLKYIFDQPEMVRVVGMAHGVLWILYVGTRRARPARLQVALENHDFSY